MLCYLEEKLIICVTIFVKQFTKFYQDNELANAETWKSIRFIL